MTADAAAGVIGWLADPAVSGLDGATLLAILGMAAVTYAIRAGGFLIARHLPRSAFFDAWLRHIPGAVFVALVTTALARGGAGWWLAAVVTLAGHRLGGLVAGLASGAAALAAVRAAGLG